jgi:hypothetical protein
LLTAGPGSVIPVDLATGAPGIPVKVGSGPDAIAISPYAANNGDGTVTPINLAPWTPGTR